MILLPIFQELNDETRSHVVRPKAGTSEAKLVEEKSHHAEISEMAAFMRTQKEIADAKVACEVAIERSRQTEAPSGRWCRSRSERRPRERQGAGLVFRIKKLLGFVLMR